MNPNFDKIIASSDRTRSGLFETTADRLGTTSQNIEKDFWVCWTLDALFNGRPSGPRLLFKGGTSLSKGFGLIRRFSEDVDVTVFRDDLGEDYSIEQLKQMSGKKRDRALDDIKAACEKYINGELLDQLTHISKETAERAGIAADQLTIEPNTEDPQSLLVRYPTATPTDAYIDKIVKIESGAKSALDPNALHAVVPYSNEDVPDLDLTVPNVTIVDAERTFWDKIVILHGLRQWYERRGELKGGGHRISRHYYDLHRLIDSDLGKAAIKDLALGADCVEHARMFFNRPDFDLASAHPPTFTLTPEGGMYDDLRRDYGAMSTMIFGDPPAFDLIVETIADVERTINAVA